MTDNPSKIPTRTVEISQDILVFSLVLFFILAIVFLMPIQPNDYWWYMRITAETLRLKALPTTEILSFTQFGQPTVYQHWLAGMLFYEAYKLGGLTLAGLLRGLAVGAFYSTLFIVLRRQGAGRGWSALIVLLAALAGSGNWAMRPQVLAYPLFGWTIWLLYRWYDGEDRSLWQLGLISLIWANLHSSFICLFLAGGAAFLFGKGKRMPLLIFLGVALIASLVTPYGLGSWTNAVSIARSSSVSQFAAEWQPPTNTGWQQNLFFLCLLAFPILVGLSNKKLSLMEWVWFGGFGWLALTSLRHEIWFTFILAAAAARVISGWSGKWAPCMKLAFPAANFIIAGLLIMGTLAFLPGLRQTWWKNSPPNLSSNTPVEAAAWLSAHPNVNGHLWTDLAYASYLSYALPEEPVWINTRMEQFPASQWQEYKDICAGLPVYEHVFARDQIQLVLASKTDQAGLITAMNKNENWKVVYEDPKSILYEAAPGK
jgi:hypothetical protein